VHAYIMMNLDQQRLSLGFLPTPLMPLPRLSKALGGPQIWMKRDDQTGLALGGNKTRKLEFLMADALAQGCDCVITAGAAQSNHCRQTAGAAAVLGLNCHLVIGGVPPEEPNGNLLLDQLLGAKLHWSGEQRKGERIHEIAEELRVQGQRPYVIPYGGSNWLGALGFVAATMELQQQMANAQQAIDVIIFASSSGGTQAGLMVGQAITKLGSQLLGIAIDKADSLNGPAQIAQLANEAAAKIGLAANYLPEHVVLNVDYLGDGYGIVGEPERAAMACVAQTEGILLDPVYTGRAMSGLIDLIHQQVLRPDQTVLFWHTGGTPALFSHAEAWL
jgi:D-cysteine desulfhydrase family pyridoxal phosphate-dependent enzyme